MSGAVEVISMDCSSIHAGDDATSVSRQKSFERNPFGVSIPLFSAWTGEILDSMKTLKKRCFAARLDEFAICLPLPCVDWSRRNRQWTGDKCLVGTDHHRWVLRQHWEYFSRKSNNWLWAMFCESVDEWKCPSGNVIWVLWSELRKKNIGFTTFNGDAKCSVCEQKKIVQLKNGKKKKKLYKTIRETDKRWRKATTLDEDIRSYQPKGFSRCLFNC